MHFQGGDFGWDVESSIYGKDQWTCSGKRIVPYNSVKFIKQNVNELDWNCYHVKQSLNLSFNVIDFWSVIKSLLEIIRLVMCHPFSLCELVFSLFEFIKSINT